MVTNFMMRLLFISNFEAAKLMTHYEKNRIILLIILY